MAGVAGTPVINGPNAWVVTTLLPLVNLTMTAADERSASLANDAAIADAGRNDLGWSWPAGSSP